jgi:GTP-binding protein HflX
MANNQSGGRKPGNSTRHIGAVDGVKGRAGRILLKAADNGTYETAKEQETAVLVSVPPRRQSEAQTTEYLDELAFLIETAGATATKRFVQRLEKPDIRTYVGEGKLAEIKAYVQHEGSSMVVFDDDLSPSQLRNLEAELLVKIVDRSRPLRARRSSWRNTSTCCPASPASGRTWISSAAAWA